MLIKNVYFLILLLNLIQNSEIIIEFKSTLSEIPKDLSPIDFFTSLISNELYTNINIGNPVQNFNFLIDFDSYHTYIIKDNNIFKNNKNTFQDSRSNSFKILTKDIFFQNLNFQRASFCSDYITINENIKNMNYSFLYVQDKKLKKNINYPGVIGMGVVSNGEPFYNEVGLIYQLRKANITNNYFYTIVFDDNSFNGKIIIGKNIYEEFSSDDFINDYCLVTYEYQYYWGWDKVESYYSSKKLEIKNIYLKPELGVIVVNLKIKDILKNKFFDEKIKEGKCYEESQLFYSFFYCDKDVMIDIDKFHFQILNNGPQLFFLESNDLILEYNNKIYFLMIFEANFPSDQIYFGYPFFKKFDLIFNQDNRKVGFYNFKINHKSKQNSNSDNDKDKTDENVDNINNNINDDNKKEEKLDNNINKNNYNIKKFFAKFLFYIFIILLVLLLTYFIFYFYRKIKRKSNEKLYEEFNNPTDNDNEK